MFAVREEKIEGKEQIVSEKALRKDPGGSVSGSEGRGQERRFEKLHEALIWRFMSDFKEFGF